MMIGLRAPAGLLFVEADSEFTFSGGPPYFGPPADFAAVAANIDALKPTMPVI